MDSNRSRRRFLQTAGLAAAALSAGCFGGGGDGTPTLTAADGGDGGGGGEATETTAANATAAANGTANATTTTDEAPELCTESAFAPVEGSDWPQVRGNTRRTGYVPGAGSIRQEAVWDRRLTGTVSAPLVAGERVVATDEAGLVRELDPDTGATRWRGTGTAHAVEGDTLVITRDRQLYGLNRKNDTDSRAWGYQFDDRPGRFSSVATRDGTAYATFSYSPGSGGSPCNPYLGVVAVDTKRGSPRWVANVDQVTCGNATGRAVGPVVAGEFVFVGFEGDGVYSLDADDGDPNWRRVFSRPYATPVAAGCSVVFGDGESTVAVDPETGETHWRHDVAPLAFAADEATIYVSTRDGRVVALVAATGERRWTAGPFGTLAGGVAVGPERVYAATATGGQESWVVAIDAAQGTLDWRLSLRGGRLTGPTLAGNRLYLGAGDPGGVHAVGEPAPTPTPDD
jgi:outer membrane protein assembly factor BamB